MMYRAAVHKLDDDELNGMMAAPSDQHCSLALSEQLSHPSARHKAVGPQLRCCGTFLHLSFKLKHKLHEQQDYSCFQWYVLLHAN